MKYQIAHIQVTKEFYENYEKQNDIKFELFLFLKKLSIKSVNEQLEDAGWDELSEKTFIKIQESYKIT